MFRNKSVDAHAFSMVPRADIPRASFKMQWTHKTTFDGGYLIPICAEEVLPGDTFKLKMTAFVRLATPLFPVMDNLHLETFFFFVPMRLVWADFVRFMGEQDSPADSISYLVPQCVSPVGGFAAGSIFDYFGLPTVGQVGGANTVSVNTLPLRAYNLIWNTWFRDENLQNSLGPLPPMPSTPDNNNLFSLQRRGKRHDYFTSCLPWPQKGGTAVSLPLGTSATVKTASSNLLSGVQPSGMSWIDSAGNAVPTLRALHTTAGAGPQAGMSISGTSTTVTVAGTSAILPGNLYADLSTATAASINQIRQAFQIQRLLERDARGGTRYTEIVRSHFGVISPDARLQRPEYLGGGSAPIVVNPIAQTSATGLTGGATPVGTLAAMGTGLATNHGFSQSFTEHGYIIGLMNVRADLTYQQGLRKMWSRSTRYDFYWPAFATLGEQAVLNKEIYADGGANDPLVFGYQERWAEYRYRPSQITGKFRSTTASPIDAWHLAQKFTSLPVLGSTFIADTPPIDRVVAVGAGANGQQLLADMFFDCVAARPMPLYSVPGMMDHF